MRILLNRNQRECDKYALLSTCQIVSLENQINTDSQDVIVLLEGNGFFESLKKAAAMNIPVAVITTKDSEEHLRAREIVHPEAIIYHEDGKIKSSKKVFSELPGVNVKTLEEISQYTLANKLFPDIFIWKPKTEVKDEVFQFHSAEPKQPKEQPIQFKPKEKLAYIPAQADLQSYIQSAEKIIAIFKTSPSADSPKIALELANWLGTVYLNISPNPAASRGPNVAVSDGNIVEYNSGFTMGKYLVAEVDVQVINAMELIYNIADKVVHVVSDLEESFEPLRSWVDAGYRLDVAIPDNADNIGAYKKSFPTMSVEEFVKSLGRQ